MAHEGLRTLVVARRKLSEAAYEDFKVRHHAASVCLEGRNEAMAAVVAESLERDLELLGLMGVGDKLQDDVRGTLELLRNAGIKIWMLTGDKIETATVIASKSLQLCLPLFKNEFVEISTKFSAVDVSRCSPMQKVDAVRLIRKFTKMRVCCIGDGRNDVSKIQAADVGVGIVCKEGKQASLAADQSRSHPTTSRPAAKTPTNAPSRASRGAATAAYPRTPI